MTQLTLTPLHEPDTTIETWTIVLTEIECDTPTIAHLAKQLVAAIAYPNTGTLTMQHWLFNEYWRSKPTPPDPRLPHDLTLIRATMT